MAARTKAKPAATKAKAAPKGKAPAKGKPKATKAAAAPKAVETLLEVGSFVKFKGYANEVDADEIAFAEGDVLYIAEVDTEGDATLYSCIPAHEVAEFLENGDENVNGGQVAPSEVTEIKGGALDKVREQYMPIAMVGRMEELLDEHGGNAIELADALNEEIQQSYFYLGGALAQVLKSGSYLTENGGEYDGDEAFNDFCQDHFGFKASKGRQLARIYSTFSALPGFDPEDLAGIGWSIAGKLEKYVTPDNVDEVLEAAKEDGVTQRTVDTVMREKFVDADGKSASGRSTTRGGDKLVTKTMSFRLSEDSADTVEIAIQQCMKQNGIESMELALERICLEWGQDHIETKTAKTNIQRKANKAAKARELAAADKPAAKAPAKKPAARGKKAA